MEFQARIFAAAGIFTALVVLYLLRGMDMPAPLAVAVAGLAGFNAGLFGSMRFGIPPDPEALANMPYRRLSTERFVAYLLLAAASIAIFAIGVAIWLPAPWSPLLLLAVGGLLMYRARLHVGEWRLEGRAAQIYGGAVVLAGLYLGYVYILRY